MGTAGQGGAVGWIFHMRKLFTLVRRLWARLWHNLHAVVLCLIPQIILPYSPPRHTINRLVLILEPFQYSRAN